MAHPEEQRFECGNCGQNFEQHSELVVHNQTKCEGKTRDGFCSEELSPTSSSNMHETPDKIWVQRSALEEPFECGICGETFKQLSDLVAHNRTHPCEKPKPDIKTISFNNCLDSHSILHSEVLPYPYGYYGNEFNQHVKEKPFCETCGKQFSSNHSLNRHKSIHSGEKPFECSTCSKRFTRRDKLLAHSRTHITRTETILPVIKENSKKPPKSPTKDDKNNTRKKAKPKPKLVVQNHALSEDNLESANCGDRNLCDSNLEGNNSTYPEEQLNQSGDQGGNRFKKHVKKEPFCEICGKQFSSNHSLSRHRTVHSGERAFECDVCGKRLTRRDKLLAHTRIHTKENTVENVQKPFECGVCGKRLTRRDKLLAHARIHTKEVEEVILPDVIITENFAEHRGLAVNDEDPTEIKPKCDICGKLFACTYNLTRHIKAHFETRTFGCNVCGKTFNRRDNWLAHSRTHTLEMPPEPTIINAVQ